MNTFTLINQRINARVLAVLTIVSLILTTLPAVFFVAEAESTGVTVDNSTLSADVDVQVNFVVSVATDDETTTEGTFIEVSDDDSGSFYTGTTGGACNSVTPDPDNEFSISGNKGVCYSNSTQGIYNITVQLLDGSGGNPIGEPKNIEVTVNELVVDQPVYGCMDDTAINFDPEATEAGDVLCEYPEIVDETIFGCMDDTAINFNPDATDEGDVVCEYDEQEPEQEQTGATLVATKIVCTDEADLPNWGANAWDEGLGITETTATDWVASHESCHLQSGWEFEWESGVWNSTEDDEEDDFVGPSGGNWNLFGSTDVNGVVSTTIPEAIYSGLDKDIWVREVLQSGYIPFTHSFFPDNSADYSAEFYCSDDAINYDNHELILGLETDETYYCVAWNVPEESEATNDALGCTDSEALNYKEEATEGNEDSESCEYSEDEIQEEGGGSGGGGGGSRRSSGTRLSQPEPTPLVLGASTSQCGMLILDYMRMGEENSEYEVTKLQIFLNGQGYFIPVTGVMDTVTDEAVRAFQRVHQIDVLDPWVEAGYANTNLPTGWVYQLTKWKINNIICPGSEPLPTLIP